MIAGRFVNLIGDLRPVCGGPAKIFHGVGIGPLSKILAVKCKIHLNENIQRERA